MKRRELSGICNRFATLSGTNERKAALYQGLLRHGVYLCELDPPRNRKFYVKVVGG